MKVALLIGQNPDAMRPFPLLFKRVGIELEVFSLTRAFHKQYPTCRVTYFDDAKLLQSLRLIDLENYSFIFLADDETIELILRSNLKDSIKQRLLPVTSSQYWQHLNSKIGLAKYLQDSGLYCPTTYIAHNKADLLNGANTLGFPLLIKKDFSSGGRGVYQCTSTEQLHKLAQRLAPFPVLMQKKIAGKVLDLSGFFQNGQLIHFTYSTFIKTSYSEFGPSILRFYYQTSHVDPLIAKELGSLGQALGLHGFANISCIEASVDQQRYYFEVDARPNAWIDFGKYIGEDLAPVLAELLKGEKVGTHLRKSHSECPSPKLIPNFLRLSLWEIATNRYNCWNYIDQIRPSEVILYNVLRRALGWIESQQYMRSMFFGNAKLNSVIEKLYFQLKRKAVGLF